MNNDSLGRVLHGGIVMVQKKEEQKHRIIIEDRKLMIITGVEKVKSFDPKEIIIDSIKGGLIIKGNNLGIKNLNLAETEVEIEGYIDVVNYIASRSADGGSKSVWERIFK